MKVALVYDRVNKFGGAEQILLALHALWPEAPLYTSVYDHKLTPWADSFEVRTSFLQKLPLPKNKHELYPYLMGPVFETFNFDEFDVVISVTHEFAKAIITKPHTLHICYCLNPVGYLWSGYDAYFSHKSNLFRQTTLSVIKYLRWYDKIIAHRPDSYMAISRTVADRIKKYYGLDSKVIYPPVSAPEVSNKKFIIKNEKYFLVVSRLVSEKRLDIAVEAFNKSGLPLRIVGTGSEKSHLKSMAGANIEFIGYVSDEEKWAYYQNCQAVIIPGEEDFNIVAVEAQMAGKPVVAFGMGGVTETVINGQTGYFFSEQTPESLVSLLKKIDFATIDGRKCIANARLFSYDRFASDFRAFVNDSYDRNHRRNNL